MALDSSFADAWAQLARAQAVYYETVTPTPAGAKTARQAVDRANALAPESPAAALAQGDYFTLVRQDLAQGRVPTGAARVLAAWVCHLRGQGAPVADVAAEEFTALAAGDLDDAVSRVLTRLGADDPRLHTAVTALARELAANMGATPGNRLPT